jgi:hypothetical protein
MNASQQPFTEIRVKLELKSGSPVSIAEKRLKVSALPPGMCWLALDAPGTPQQLLPPFWFLDEGVRTWHRTSTGALEEATREKRLEMGQGATHVVLHHGDPIEVLQLEDVWA